MSILSFSLPSPLAVLTLTPDQDAPSLAGQAPAGDTLTSTPGAIGAGGSAPGAAKPAGGPDMSFMLVILVIVVVMFLMTSLGTRRETKRKQSLLDSLKKYDRVQTSGGIIGSVVEIKPDVVVLKVDENSNTRIPFAKASIIAVLKEGPQTAAASDAATPAKSVT